MQSFEVQTQTITEEQKQYNEDPEKLIQIKTFQKQNEIDFGSKFIIEQNKGVTFQGTNKELQYVISNFSMGNEKMKGAKFFAKIQIQEIHQGTIDIGIVQEDKRNNWAKINSEEYFSKDVVGQSFYNHMYYLQDQKEVSNNYFSEKVKEGDVLHIYLDTGKGIFKVQLNDNPNQRYQTMENFQNLISQNSYRFFIRFFNSKGVINILQE